MSLEKNQLQFLWHLFHLHFLNGASKEALAWVASMYEVCGDLPEALESLLLKYWKEGEESALIDAGAMAARLFYFETEQQVILVSLLVERKGLEIEEAASLLNSRGVNLDTLPKSIGNAINVAWLVNQDSQLGVMSPEQDSLLKDALQSVVREFTD